MECTLLFWPSQSELDPGFDMPQNESDLAGPMEKKNQQLQNTIF